MPSKLNAAEVIAEDYYDSQDADNFYEKLWGGEDIHIGLYADGLSVREASRLTVVAMADKLPALTAESKVIDLGAGYGGAGRYLASRFGCQVSCLNLSEVQNRRNRMLNAEQKLDRLVSVLYGSYEHIPEPDASYDVVWSQDAFLHSSKKELVVSEAARVLKPGGQIIFTDPMQADNCPEGVLQPVYDRLSLDSMGSFAFYRKEFSKLGFVEIECEVLTHQLRAHYDHLKALLEERYDDLATTISTQYLDKMIAGLNHWVIAADSGYLSWGILQFRKAD